MARRYEDLQLDPLKPGYVLLEIMGTWPNLVGVHYIIGAQLLADRNPHLRVVPMFPGYSDPDGRTNMRRVYVYFDENGIIDKIPRLG